MNASEYSGTPSDGLPLSSPAHSWRACCAQNLLSSEWILALSIFCSVLWHIFNEHELRASTPSVCSADGSGSGFSKIIFFWVQEAPWGLWTYLALRGLGKGGILAITGFMPSQRDPSLTLAWGPAFHSCYATWVWKTLGKGCWRESPKDLFGPGDKEEVSEVFCSAWQRPPLPETFETLLEKPLGLLCTSLPSALLKPLARSTNCHSPWRTEHASDAELCVCAACLS